MKAGDLIGFSGASGISDLVNIATLGVPRWDLSHVGILAEYKGETLLFESTTLDPLPCVIQQKLFNGVQAHRLDEVVKNYQGRVWEYPLARPLYPHENARLSEFLVRMIGTPYDAMGAMRSADLGLSYVEAMLSPEGLHQVYCSELCARAYEEIGAATECLRGRFNPNRLARHLRHHGLLLRPLRLK